MLLSTAKVSKGDAVTTTAVEDKKVGETPEPEQKKVQPENPAASDDLSKIERFSHGTERKLTDFDKLMHLFGYAVSIVWGSLTRLSGMIGAAVFDGLVGGIIWSILFNSGLMGLLISVIFSTVISMAWHSILRYLFFDRPKDVTLWEQVGKMPGRYWAALGCIVVFSAPDTIYDGRIVTLAMSNWDSAVMKATPWGPPPGVDAFTYWTGFTGVNMLTAAGELIGAICLLKMLSLYPRLLPASPVGAVVTTTSADDKTEILAVDEAATLPIAATSDKSDVTTTTKDDTDGDSSSGGITPQLAAASA